MAYRIGSILRNEKVKIVLNVMIVGIQELLGYLMKQFITVQYARREKQEQQKTSTGMILN